jgi:hypothetical protein
MCGSNLRLVRGARYLDNESRGSVSVSSTLLFIQSYLLLIQTNQLSKNNYISILKQKKTPKFDRKRPKRSTIRIMYMIET